MPTPSSDRSQAAAAFEPIPLHDPTADIGRSERRPTWWLDESEHASLLGTGSRPKAPQARFAAKRQRTELPVPAPQPAETVPAADFAALAPTLASLDRILQPLPADAPGLPRLRSDQIKRLGRFGAALGFATLAAVVVFFR